MLPSVADHQIPKKLLQDADRFIVVGPKLLQERVPSFRSGCGSLKVKGNRMMSIEGRRVRMQSPARHVGQPVSARDYFIGQIAVIPKPRGRRDRLVDVGDGSQSIHEIGNLIARWCKWPEFRAALHLVPIDCVLEVSILLGTQSGLIKLRPACSVPVVECTSLMY